MANSPIYRLVTGDERSRVLVEYPPSDPMPPYGELVAVEVGSQGYLGRFYLYWKNTLGVLFVIDVTAAPPAQFYQRMPIPETFWTEVFRRLGETADVATTVALHLPEILYVGLAVLVVLLVVRILR